MPKNEQASPEDPDAPETPDVPPMPPPGRLYGVFSKSQAAKPGSGGSGGSGGAGLETVKTHYFFAEEQDDGSILLQALNPRMVPSGKKRKIERDLLLAEFTPEPEIYQKNTFPLMRRMRQAVAKGDAFREMDHPYSAEVEYSSALKIDEEHIRANFGIGLCYLKMEQTDKAGEVFRRLVQLDEAFEAEHKHLFNEFGIGLRKKGMHKLAVDYYTKAAGLAPDDEHLHFNIARASHAMGDLDKARDHLRTCLEMNPDFQDARQFLRVLDEQG
jgi:tetratricopeptide (TPR) repeat protein